MKGDPRLTEVTQANYEEQFRISRAVRDTLSQIYDAIRQIRAIRAQVESVIERAKPAG